MNTAPLDSLDTFTPDEGVTTEEVVEEGGIPAIRDIPLTVVNDILYNQPKRRTRHKKTRSSQIFQM